MQQNLPYSIRNEQDLDVFQRYIDEMPDTNTNTRPAACEQMIPIAKGQNNMSLIPSFNGATPEVLTNTCFLPAYLTKHIGKLMRVEFLLANNLHVRTGILMTVGATYIVLKSPQNRCTIACDLESIRFVTIAHDNNFRKLLKS